VVPEAVTRLVAALSCKRTVINCHLSTHYSTGALQRLRIWQFSSGRVPKRTEIYTGWPKKWSIPNYQQTRLCHTKATRI